MHSDLERRIKDFDLIASQTGVLPVKISPFYRRKVAEEIEVLGHERGPLSQGILPDLKRFELRAPGEVADFVEDRENMPDETPDTIVQKYRNRLLFFPTDICAAHCQYCFRTNVLSEQHDKVLPSFEEKLKRLISYLQKHPEVEEVILSGGDPMTLSKGMLIETLTRLKEEASIGHIRLHTRTMAFSPKVFSEEKLEVLAATKVRLVHHIIHPYEICNEVREKIELINSYRIPQYNQFPILRQINDHSEVLRLLLTDLDSLHIRNLSMFIPDPINYSAKYRIALERLFAIMDNLNWTTPSWINSTRLVLDTQHGKVRREDLIRIDTEQNMAFFSREGNLIEYPNLPEEMDIAGDINTMLWKNNI
jgi:lysine 2,3-aminomutase